MFDEQASSRPRVTVQGSVAVEIDWAMSLAHQGGRSDSPLSGFYAAHEELAERIRTLWPAEDQLSYPGYPELSILARRGQLLLSMDSRTLLDRLEDLAVAPEEVGGLEAETPEDRARIRHRLERLRSSRTQRRRYITVVRELWAEVGPLWEHSGRPAVEGAMEARRAAVAADPQWDPASACSAEYADRTRALVAQLPPGGEVAVVPAYFTRKGLLIDLPGLVLVGVRAEPVEETSRSRAEGLARRLKAISDPTRLALMETIGRRPMTVSELASMYSLAQPTISNHVKVLRDAGLVVQGGDARRRELTVRPEAVAELLAELERFLPS